MKWKRDKAEPGKPTWLDVLMIFMILVAGALALLHSNDADANYDDGIFSNTKGPNTMEINFEHDTNTPVDVTIGQGTVKGCVIGVAQFEDRAGPSYLCEWLNHSGERQSEWMQGDALALTAGT